MDTKNGKRKLERLFKNESLNLGRDIANTAKHRGRNEEGDRNAVVRRVHHRDGDSESVDIEWWMHNQEDDPASKEQWVQFAEATGGEDPSWWWTEEEES
jgi:hypothetical protein